MEVCVKKLLMLFAVMTACAACGKDDGGITMEAVRLEGTYWLSLIHISEPTRH